MKWLVVLAALLAAATAAQAQVPETRSLDTAAKRIEIIRERINAPHDQRLDEAERQLSRPHPSDLDLATIDLQLQERQLETGSAFLEDRRFDR